MKPFTSIAIPHIDIIEGRLTEDVFAADLWEVFKGRGPEDYRDPDTFFRKTYLTEGIRNLLSVAEKRLKGLGGDPVIQLQTPFGGGKTHSLIALYHKARSWGVNVVVLDGTALDPKEQTIWGEIERQLTGRVEKFEGQVPPGTEKLRDLLEKHQPVLILMDEILTYTTKAAGIRVGESNLAAQVLVFMHELTRAVSSLDKCLLVLTLPSSLLERYDESAEMLFQQLQKVAGRMEKVYAPVKDEEVASVIRARLFSSVDEKEAEKVIDEFLDYAEREGLLPRGLERSEYKKRFLKSYPFQPEVIEVLYTRWGSFPTFQRTRGVLRLLSLVVHSLKESKVPFIRLGDFDLANDEIRRELIKHIGSQYDSVLASDITGSDAGARRVDADLGKAYLAYRFGTRVATTIFLYSFSGGVERGATIADVKLTCSEIGVPSSVIIEVISKLKERLFYLQSDGKLFFSDQPNLNRIVITKMENITDEEVREEEEKILSNLFSKRYFEVYLWPKNTKDVPDTKKLKLVILQNDDKEFCKSIIENYGENPRVHRNTLIFLCPRSSERMGFDDFLRRKIAWEAIQKDELLALTESQKKEVSEKIASLRRDVVKKVRELYRTLYLPSREGLEEIDMGIPVIGAQTALDNEVFERLAGEKIATKIDPSFLGEKYLKGRDYINVKSLLNSFYNTPGELRIISDDIFKESVKKGVAEGRFGYGVLEGEKPVCKHFKSDFTPEITDDSILIRPELCVAETDLQVFVDEIRKATSVEELEEIKKRIPWNKLIDKQKDALEKELELKEKDLRIRKTKEYSFVHLVLKVPSGKLSDVVKMTNFLKTKFEEVTVKVDILARGGGLKPEEYKEKIEEAINQSQIEVEKEEKS
ncbi:MAG: DUF499 domain-containing protein [Sulfolobales archaeon]